MRDLSSIKIEPVDKGYASIQSSMEQQTPPRPPRPFPTRRDKTQPEVSSSDEEVESLPHQLDREV